MKSNHRFKLGEIGEAAVSRKLQSLGWEVKDLNKEKNNYPNCDIEATKNQHHHFIQVKACSSYRWISAGGINEKVCGGEPIFNRVRNVPVSSFIICLTPKAPVAKGEMPDVWRYFVLPVTVAESAFRINVDAYFNGVRVNDGKPRKKTGACQDFVGPGRINSNVVPDHSEDFLPYENDFSVLEVEI